MEGLTRMNWKQKCRELQNQLAIYEQLATVSASVADMALFQKQMVEDREEELREWADEVVKSIELVDCKECDGTGVVGDTDDKCALCGGYRVRVFISNPQKLVELLGG